MTAWLLIVLVFAVLWVFWQALNLVADVIDQVQAAADRSSEAMSSDREKEQSGSSCSVHRS